MSTVGDNGTAAPTSGADDQAVDGGGGFEHSSEPDAKAISRKLLIGLAVFGVFGGGLVHQLLPSILAKSKETYCSYWPAPNPPPGSKFAVLIASDFPEGQRQQFQDALAAELSQKEIAAVDFQSACRPLTSAEGLKKVKNSPYQAALLVSAPGQHNNRQLRATIITKTGSKLTFQNSPELDAGFGSAALAQFMAERLLLPAYDQLSDEWEQKLQKTTDNQIERSPASDKRADEISELAAIPALQGSCKAQRLAADALLFARRPEDARQQLQTKARLACSKDPEAAAGLLARLIVVEIESARDTSNSMAHRAFYDTALGVVEEFWALPEELREHYSGIAIALAWKVRPRNLTAADLRKFKERSAEAQRHPTTLKNSNLYVALDQQQKNISPLLSDTESKEKAIAAQIRENAETEQKRASESIENAKAEGAAVARRTAEQIASAEMARATERETDLAGQLVMLKQQLAKKDAEVDEITGRVGTRDKEILDLKTERDQVLRAYHDRIQVENSKKAEETNKAKERASRSEPRPSCVVIARRPSYILKRCTRTAAR
jgi:hypothetical protein